MGDVTNGVLGPAQWGRPGGYPTSGPPRFVLGNGGEGPLVPIGTGGLVGELPPWLAAGPLTWAGDTGGTVGDTTLGALGSSFPGLPAAGFLVPGGLGAFSQPPSGTAGGGNLLPLLLVGGGVVAFLWWRTHG